MILIGAINVGIGMCTYDPPSTKHERIQIVVPQSTLRTPAPKPMVDAGVDAAAADGQR